MAKKDKGIRLSPKHGLNPSLIVCALCGKETGAIALLGKIGKGKKDQEAPKHISDGNICDDCKNKLEEEKVRCFVDIGTGRYAKVPDSSISPEYLAKVKDLRWIPQPTEHWEAVFGAGK